MARKQTGAPRLRGEKWWARVPLGGERLSIALATCKRSDDAKARERAALLCQLAAKLEGAGHLTAQVGEQKTPDHAVFEGNQAPFFLK